MVSGYPVPSGDVTNQTSPGRVIIKFSRPGRFWLVTSRLRTGKPPTFFTVYVHRQKVYLIFFPDSAVKREPGPGLWSITNNMDVLDDNMSKKFKTKSNLSEIGK